MDSQLANTLAFMQAVWHTGAKRERGWEERKYEAVDEALSGDHQISMTGLQARASRCSDRPGRAEA